MSSVMPLAIALFVCLTEPDGLTDQNADYTHYESLQWATPNNQMVCRRQIIPLTDWEAEKGAVPITPNLLDKSVCARVGIPIGVQWDMEHKNSKYRFFRIGCPSLSIVNGKPVFQLPDCFHGHAKEIKCESDEEI